MRLLKWHADTSRSVGAVSLLPMASQNLGFYAVWEIKNGSISFMQLGCCIQRRFITPNHMAFYDLVGHFSTHVTIPKAAWKMAKTQGQLF